MDKRVFIEANIDSRDNGMIRVYLKGGETLSYTFVGNGMARKAANHLHHNVSRAGYLVTSIGFVPRALCACEVPGGELIHQECIEDSSRFGVGT